MSKQIKWFRLFLSLLLGIMWLNSGAMQSDNSITLYTPYTKIAVPPGESVDYSIDVINNSKELKNVDISVTGVPRSWNSVIKSGGWTIRQLSVLPGEKKSFSLRIEIPFKVNKGNYPFKVVAGGFCSMPLVVNISEQGTFKTEFTTPQSNMEGHTNSNFNFSAILKNRTAEKQLYALMADAPRGWNVTFKAANQQVTSVNSEANATTPVIIEVKPPERVEAGKYKIPVSAATNSSSASLEFEVVIRGSYQMELTTPTGLLSTTITAGDLKRVELLLKNTGSSELKDVKFESNAPTNWEVTFDPGKLDALQPGSETRVFASVKADKKAIPGDYATNLEARTPETSSKISFRISVETPLLWGWIGVLVILAALGSVYYLFRKYGRR